MSREVVKKIAFDFCQQFAFLSDDQLRDVITECEKLTETNCWHVEYALRDAVIERAHSEVELRRFVETPGKGIPVGLGDKDDV